MRLLLLAGTLSLALAGAALARPQAKSPERDFAPLETATRALAKAGRAAEVDEAFEVLTALGYSSAKAAKLHAACAADAPKAGKAPPASAAADAGRALRAAARALAKSLATATSPEKEELARRILQLDASVDDAHAALGEEKIDGRWSSAEERAMRARRAEIEDALRRARRLPVPLQVSESSHPILLAAHGTKGTVAKLGKFELHTPWSAEKTARLLRESLRALALSHFLVTGTLEIPANIQSVNVLMADKAALKKAVEASRAAKTIDEKSATAIEAGTGLAGFHDQRGYSVDRCVTESEAECLLLYYWSDDLELYPACILAGHVNWVSLAYFGAPIPGLVWTDDKSGTPPHTTTDVSEAERKRREEMLRLASAGIAGCRTWMAYLAARREDPPWSRAMVDEPGKIVGDALLKATSVMEMFQEMGVLATRLKKLRAKSPEAARKSTPADFEKALGEPLAAFEARWRRWILAGQGSIAERVEKKELPRSKTDLEVLAALKSVRTRAGLDAIQDARAEVDLEPSLSEGARLHSLYLAQHPKQQTAWPDAHEEYPDKEGFTPEGAWAGTHAVIAPGTTTPQAAIDAWMATFYHRLPLLEPGLVRVGWSQEKNIAVLDASSLCKPMLTEWEVAWPPDGMTGVPTRFAPELPNPVPAEEESEFGYPITLQLGVPNREAPQHDLRMTLHESNASGREVPCWFSTPMNPTNPELSPAGAFCLIPKSPLKAKSTYVVVAEWIGVSKTKTWSFKT